MNHYQDTQSAEPFMVETRVPIGASRVETHVIVPFLIALLTMALITLDVLLWQWRPIAGAVGAAGLLAFAWRILKADGGLTRLETITGLELDGKPGLGKPDHPFVLTDKGEARSRADTLAANVWRESRAAELVRFAAACAAQGTSEAAQNVNSKAQRAAYLECRQALFDLGLATWKNPAVPNSAWVLRLPPTETAQFIENYVK